MRGNGSTRTAFAAVTILFFAWGFITSLIDPLVAAVKGVFTLTTLQAQLSTFAFFIAYGAMSFPAAILIARAGAVRAILLALAVMALACLIMLAAADTGSYPLVLAGLFILASGVTTLQVAANPLAAALGPPEASHFRLTLSQAFNSLGTIIGPLLGAALFLKDVEARPGIAMTRAARAASLSGINGAYLWIFALLVLLALFFWANRSLIARATAASNRPSADVASLVGAALGDRWACLGAIAIFLYVGAEVSIGTQMAFLLHSPDVWGRISMVVHVPLLGSDMALGGMTLAMAGKAVACYWAGAMIGRLLGSILLARIDAAKLLALFTAMAAAMCLYVMTVGGTGAGFVALAIGLFNSIMFPVIFTLTLERSRAATEATSGLLCTAIIGGAFLPLATGKLADVTQSFTASFLVPAICYVLLMIFAFLAGAARKIRQAEALSGH